MIWLAAALGTIAAVVAGTRWLRVMQREHYIAGSATVVTRRWFARRPPNAALALVGVAAMVVTFAAPRGTSRCRRDRRGRHGGIVPVRHDRARA